MYRTNIRCTVGRDTWSRKSKVWPNLSIKVQKAPTTPLTNKTHLLSDPIKRTLKLQPEPHECSLSDGLLSVLTIYPFTICLDSVSLYNLCLNSVFFYTLCLDSVFLYNLCLNSVSLYNLCLDSLSLYNLSLDSVSLYNPYCSFSPNKIIMLLLQICVCSSFQSFEWGTKNLKTQVRIPTTSSRAATGD